MINVFKINKIDHLISEIKKIGQLLKNNKSNKKWSEVVNIKKNTTQADLNMDQLLKKIIIKHGYDAPYYSEEVLHDFKERPNEYWLADPIDGTASWLGGYVGYVVQAVFIRDNKPIFSFIYWPERDQFYHCFTGEGVLLNNSRMVNNNNDTTKIVIVDNYAKPKGFITKLFEKHPNFEYLEMGSLGLKSLLVAIDKCDLFIKTTPYKDWDVLPAFNIINEMKYKMLSLNGDTINFGKQLNFTNGLLVFNPYRINQNIIDYIHKQGG
jgi:3'-phosphoadenosine 5'-phosphosulfate (PAPS) 3'-phosphatase